MMEEEREKEFISDYYGPSWSPRETLMLPLGNRGSNNPELWPSQPKGMVGPAQAEHIHDSVFFFFSGENSVIVDLALGLSQQALKSMTGNTGLPEFFQWFGHTQ